ncbi:hypothetical protein AB835_00530 [Candidatus Endobugula sertula]|uniref:Uncharacterized protein n=1 Tax=Candidatus Endobugula sertula TaxID=62101 RepID=A0A1D2QTX7_9GAMM|nr:hypothetical protein AB835_00530 [Candidatus Endobugula sertula]
MASTYWRTDYTIETLLSEREVGWEFLQLVKLILLIANRDGPADDNSVLDLLVKNIKFRASLAADFPPGEIREVKRQGIDKPVSITLVNNVLTAINGPLPEPFIAWVRRLSHSGDHAMADFLDLFNNRLMALRYLICRVTRPNLIDAAADNTETGAMFYSLSGAVFNRKVQDVDLRLAGILANNRMSFPVVKQMLRFCMSLPLKKMNSYQGGWLVVDEQDHSTLGNSYVCRLGQTATLGKKVWDQQQSIEMVIGPLSWLQVKSLVPGGNAHSHFVELLKRMTDCRCDCKIILLLPQNQAPSVKLRVENNTISAVTIKDTDNSTLKKGVPLSRQASEILALGLTTTLVTATKRVVPDKLVQVCFTIETSNSEKQFAA